jgi:hypothetical protein
LRSAPEHHGAESDDRQQVLERDSHRKARLKFELAAEEDFDFTRFSSADESAGHRPRRYTGSFRRDLWQLFSA